MAKTAINHMTAANASFGELLSMAQACRCSGVELRTDLAGPLFDGRPAAEAKHEAQQAGINIIALAEVVAFNRYTEQTRQQALNLSGLARDCGAQGIVLIPANDGPLPDAKKRQSMLLSALEALLPVLEQHQLTGFIEPLGFDTSTLRYKTEAMEAIDKLHAHHRLKLIHDTFHHHLAGESEYFASSTAIVHVSGVIDTALTSAMMQDHHRVLVNEYDRLNNLTQLQMLHAGGFRGPVSVEAFAPEIHALSNLAEHLQDSFKFISSALAADAA